MRVLVENSGYNLTNLGDVAMLQAAVQRLAELWPDAYIEVITSDAALLQKFCPGAHPLLIPGLSRWGHIRHLADPQFDVLSDWARRHMSGAWHLFLGMEPGSLERRWKGYVDAARQSDLVLAAGGGYINDTFAAHGVGVLSTLEEAIKHGKPAVMVGQGFEPAREPAMRAKAASVLPRLTLIGCREGKLGPSTLAAMGVRPDIVFVTGDEAIELIYRGRPAQLGAGLGVNLRVTWYAGVQTDMVATVQSVLQAAARKYGAMLAPLPISVRSPSDADSISRLVQGAPNRLSDGRELDTPQKVMQRAGGCRVAVTGSYHGAVFSLSQGVSAVCLAETEYYVRKFVGLVDLFGAGCRVLSMHDLDLRRKLAEAIDQAWASADENRAGLLAAAAQQIRAGRDLYGRIFEATRTRSLPVAIR